MSRFFLFLAVLMLAVTTSGASWALFISPTRVMFDNNTRTAQVIIHNRGNQTTVVTFDWDQMCMQEGGRLVRLDDPAQMPNCRSAGEYITFSPRRAVLKANQTQKIRLLLQKPANLPDGEYHSHFKIISSPLKSDLDDAPGEDKFAIKMDTRVSKAIPIFVRQGNTVLDVKMHNGSVIQKGAQKYVRLDVENRGTRSLYARVRLECSVGGGAQPITNDQRVVRVYAEAARVQRDVPVGDLPLDRCQSLSASLLPEDDFEKSGQVIDRITIF